MYQSCLLAVASALKIEFLLIGFVYFVAFAAFADFKSINPQLPKYTVMTLMQIANLNLAQTAVDFGKP